MELRELKTNIRKNFGNGPARVLRRNGQVPAVLYGPHQDPISISMKLLDFESAIKNRNLNQVVFNIVTEDDSIPPAPAMIKEVQTHPVSRALLHVDFYHIEMDKKIRVKVPVFTTGKSIGVEMGGMLQLIRRELEILCQPMQIPESITIDVSQLNIGESIHVQEISLDENIELPSDANFTVATVIGKKATETTAEEEGEEEEGGAEASAAGE